jgi:hypothetical protein
VIELLNASFVNTWVLRKDLPTIRETATTPEQRHLTEAIINARLSGSPVDCMVFSPHLRMLACEPVHGILGSGSTKRYLRFLNEALATLTAGGGQRHLHANPASGSAVQTAATDAARLWMTFRFR